ncbi:MAG TPA: transglycosylase family protein [Acidimicrobiales bacterium]|nr:transglycosylase family protein [Acidimicrobiales bacterium]
MKRLAAVVAAGFLAFAAPADAHRPPRSPASAGTLPTDRTVVDAARESMRLASVPSAAPATPTTARDPVDRARLGRVRADRGGGRASDDIWVALARCESGGDPAAVGGGGAYHGAFQFTLTTWHSLGYAGDPLDYPFAVQLEAAKRLQARSGWAQWPACSRRLGLR